MQTLLGGSLPLFGRMSMFSTHGELCWHGQTLQNCPIKICSVPGGRIMIG